MVVVAVAVTVVTAGSFGPEAEAALASELGSTAAANVAIGVAAGAAGSVTSQAVGIAIGAQDGFSWSSVALSTIGGGASFGIGGLPGATPISPLAAAGNAALSSVASQEIGVLTHLQSAFSWRGVVASAAGAGVGAEVGAQIGRSEHHRYLGCVRQDRHRQLRDRHALRLQRGRHHGDIKGW